MKKLLAIFALAVAMTCNANAATETNSGSDLMAATQIQAAFQQDEQPMQMVALSGQEMSATEGALWWFFVPLVVRGTPALISYAAGTGGTFMIPTWYGRIRSW
jgi:hypothetical protein